jgi:hypothetical protein
MNGAKSSWVLVAFGVASSFTFTFGDSSCSAIYAGSPQSFTIVDEECWFMCTIIPGEGMYVTALQSGA